VHQLPNLNIRRGNAGGSFLLAIHAASMEGYENGNQDKAQPASGEEVLEDRVALADILFQKEKSVRPLVPNAGLAVGAALGGNVGGDLAVQEFECPAASSDLIAYLDKAYNIPTTRKVPCQGFGKPCSPRGREGARDAHTTTGLRSVGYSQRGRNRRGEVVLSHWGEDKGLEELSEAIPRQRLTALSSAADVSPDGIYARGELPPEADDMAPVPTGHLERLVSP